MRGRSSTIGAVVLLPPFAQTSLVMAQIRLKDYPHFDAPLSTKAVRRILNDPLKVAQNPFYPFLSFQKHWQPFRSRETRPNVKKRTICYAARRDAYIFAHYRDILSKLYEAELQKRGINECPIAYRRIPVSQNSRSGKCNIHFAYDAFNSIESFGKCVVVALDISKFFDTIDHAVLYQQWCALLGLSHLPSDHQAVYQAITRYSVVDRQAAYERLGFYGEKNIGTEIEVGYLIPKEFIPKQLCSPKDFHIKICGKGADYESLVRKNPNDYGIPQGSPISDILANLYLIDFDQEVNEFVSSRGGIYRRYSDDILVIIPDGCGDPFDVHDWISHRISKYGKMVKIKREKTSILRYDLSPGIAPFILIDGLAGRNGLEYLGFRFDGKQVYLRDATLSSFHRKLTIMARFEAQNLVARFPGKNSDFINSQFNVSKFSARFGRVEDFDECHEYRSWTFWTYVQKAAAVFGKKGIKIVGQVGNYNKKARKLFEAQVKRSLAQRSES